MLSFEAIYCRSSDYIIGKGEHVPNSKTDKAHFNGVINYSPTSQPNLLIVGKRTYDTLPKILKTRCYIHHDITETYNHCLANRNKYHKFIVIGGGYTYKQFFDADLITAVYETEFMCELGEEVNIQSLPPNRFKLISSHTLNDSLTYLSQTYDTVVHEFRYYTRETNRFEFEYLKLLNHIKLNGTDKQSRSGNVRSINDYSYTINLSDGFPILTLRRSFFKGIVEELLWFISGSSDANILKHRGVHIWDLHSSREYLDSVNLYHLPEGNIGHGYGYQLRNYNGQGVDQLNRVIDEIKTNPHSRRLIINLWNPCQLDSTALPPCHLLYQFSVCDGKLNCHLYQRSWDILIGWNPSTAALLTHILADQCGLNVGKLTHSICDVHVYENNLDKVDILLNRMPYILPTLTVNSQAKVEDYKPSDFKLIDYVYHERVNLILS